MILFLESTKVLGFYGWYRIDIYVQTSRPSPVTPAQFQIWSVAVLQSNIEITFFCYCHHYLAPVLISFVDETVSLFQTAKESWIDACMKSTCTR